MRPVAETLRIGDLLDARFARLRGTMPTSKERSLVELARVLDAHRTPYALIGGLAVQTWSADPRTTLDIDIAVVAYDDLPADDLRAAGFRESGEFEHSRNWRGPDGTPVQFTDDSGFARAIELAETRQVGGVPLRIAPVAELVRAKLRAAADPGRRRSKRIMDLADASALVEQYPDVRDVLSEAERDILSRPL